MGIENFSDRLRHARVQAKLTQDQLAEALGVTKSAVSSWENGGAYPSMDKLPTLRLLLEVSLDNLICGDAGAASYARRALEILQEGAGAYSVGEHAKPSADENRLIRQYRAMTNRRRKALLIFLGDEGG